MPKEITIEYFAVFLQKRGVQRETLHTESATVRELFAELKEKFGFTLPEHTVKVAVNEKVVPWNASLNSGDKVLFIPTIAGG